MFRAFVAILGCIIASASSAETLTVSAAISLKEPLTAIARDYETATGTKVELNFGASGQLMTQIRQGAPVDLFISASATQTTQLRKDGFGTAAADKVIARNRLVLIAPAGTTGPRSFADLGDAAWSRIALGQPKTVPAGEYARQVLEKLGIASAVKDRLVYGANVRQVLDYVVRGEVDAGIVYATDAREAGSTVRVVATADPSWHKPIAYPAILLSSSQHSAAAADFLNYLLSTKAQTQLVQCGFEVDAP